MNAENNQVSRKQAGTVVYTDGSCLGNPGPGGWGWVVPGVRWRSGFEPRSTNQRMELAAALDAAQSLETPLVVVSDSTYVVNCFRKNWWKGWIARGWVNTKRQPVVNRDLWEPLVKIYLKGGLSFRWVRGHSGNRWNDTADRLAASAASAQRAAEGFGAPNAGVLGNTRRGSKRGSSNRRRRPPRRR